MITPVEQVLLDEAAKAAAERGAMTIFILKIYSVIHGISFDQAQMEFAQAVVNGEDCERFRLASELQMKE